MCISNVITTREVQLQIQCRIQLSNLELNLRLMRSCFDLAWVSLLRVYLFFNKIV